MTIYHRPYQLANALGVSARTVHRWIQLGKVKVVRAGWQVRITDEEYNRVLHDGVTMRRPETSQPSPAM